ncbi:MAG TPA: phosphoribosylformylglycinamidine synthase subunit PurL [Nitrososphaerales archaeon]|nr:phosphoribosylformylglycinamidine synthase subunit PurL [Nitrososphaerales archaeon]
MRAEQLGLGLTADEIATVRRSLGREPNETEWSMIDAEWSEHSSYKSSKALLKLFPTTGKRVVLGPGYDAGVVDVGGGYVATLHIESHNHPSAIDPYGGASTGIGGVLRDILSVASRPIALVDILRFGLIDESGHSRWLFKNVVRGIADYGNCVGVPTVAGEVEFDDSFERNCLVDVACVGIAKKGGLILGEAKKPGDVLVLIGGSTGRDGIKGATFASANLKADAASDRSSVQVPDPFIKKLLLDSLLEVIESGENIPGMKDLGGGGLSTALSEVASKGGTGVDVELKRVRLREQDMSPTEIMTSESQERMLLVLPASAASSKSGVIKILEKYDVPYSVIGRVTAHPNLVIRWGGKVVADLPASLVTEAPLIPWPSRKPKKPVGSSRSRASGQPSSIQEALITILSSPNVASKRWVFRQYDHEVGIRTVVRPGQGDAAVLRLPNGKFLAIKGDGNSKHASLDPYAGAAGCVAEACRNVVAVGGEPIALVDHLQSGDPSDPEVYWTFREALQGMADYCRAFGLPVVGGKVSFYNEDSATGRAIKPSPIALVVGLIEDQSRIKTMSFKGAGESVFVLGETRPELGGSEYSAKFSVAKGAGAAPRPDPAVDLATCKAVLGLIEDGLVSSVHDCSNGGLGVALAEMAMAGGVGARIDLTKVPTTCEAEAETLFSESHGRFVLSGGDERALLAALRRSGVPHAVIGKVGGAALSLATGRGAARLRVASMKARFEGAIPELMD